MINSTATNGDFTVTSSTNLNIDSNTVRFGYFRTNTSHGGGYICLAMSRPPKGSQPGLCHFGIAYCSPKDKFNKKLARQIATGRMLKNPLIFKDIPGPAGQVMKKALEMFMKDAPSWVIKAKAIHFGLNPNVNNLVNLLK